MIFLDYLQNTNNNSFHHSLKFEKKIFATQCENFKTGIEKKIHFYFKFEFEYPYGYKNGRLMLLEVQNDLGGHFDLHMRTQAHGPTLMQKMEGTDSQQPYYDLVHARNKSN